MTHRLMDCGKEITALGQEGSIKDLSVKLNVCFGCVDFVSCRKYIHYSKQLTTALESLDYMNNKLKEERGSV